MLVAVVEIGAVAAIVASQCGPVKRKRLERFAALHDLDITLGNGAMVISYLRTTRRWRAAGFLTGLAVYLLVKVVRGEISLGIGFDYPFLGWYTGAVIAELRLRRPHGGDRRPPALLSMPAQFLSILAVAGWVFVLLSAVTDGIQETVTLVLAAAVALLSVLIQLKLARGPVPGADDDVIRAGLAMRSRSLHVLAVGAPVFLACAVTKAISSAGPAQPDTAQISIHLDLYGLFLVLLVVVVWKVATRPHPIRLHEASAV
ncbi:hypothetical protein ACOZ38_01530 [Sphaerisporangium viridialbum]|uniref:hypothetical protein n=1 Tax=Sphaerisporangium viridialbum TaxID=46189 RepID=UPI003C71D896